MRLAALATMVALASTDPTAAARCQGGQIIPVSPAITPQQPFGFERAWMNGDGSRVCGTRVGPGGERWLAIWDLNDGWIQLTTPGQYPFPRVTGFSADGRTAALAVPELPGGVIWTESGGVQALPVPPGTAVTLTAGLSLDGRTAVGVTYTSIGGTGTPVRWDQVGGTGFGQATPLCASQVGCAWPLKPNADGSVIVGTSPPNTSSFSVDRWTAGTGFERIYQGPLSSQLARTIETSDDGSTVALWDQGSFGTSPSRTLLWRLGTGLIDLGATPGPSPTTVVSLSGDGQRVLTGSGPSNAFQLFQSGQGLSDFRAALAAQGLIDLAAYRITPAGDRCLARNGRAALVQLSTVDFDQDEGRRDFLAVAYFDGPPPGAIGTTSCSPNALNSGLLPGSLRAVGSVLAADNDLTLVATALPPNVVGYALNGRGIGAGFTPPGAAGELCLDAAAGVGRHNRPSEIGFSGPQGEIRVGIDLTSMPRPTGLTSAVAGETWTFQLWHRDQAGGQGTSNFTDAVVLTWQ